MATSKDTRDACAVCPISHIPVPELTHPVVFRDNSNTVFEAEFIVTWLKNHRLIHPVSHVPVSPGLASSILSPCGLGLQAETRTYLERAGFLDGTGGQVSMPVNRADDAIVL